MAFGTPFGGTFAQRWLFAKAGSTKIPAWGLVEITGSTQIQDRLIYNVDRPDEDAALLIAVNGPRPIRANGYGRITQDWPALCLYDDADTPAVGETWGSSEDSFKLTKDNNGLIVVGDPLTDPANIVPVTALSGGRTLLGKLDEELTNGSFATMSVWTGPAGTSADTGIDVTVYDWLLSQGSIASGKKIMAHWADNAYYVGSVEC